MAVLCSPILRPSRPSRVLADTLGTTDGKVTGASTGASWTLGGEWALGAPEAGELLRNSGYILWRHSSLTRLSTEYSFVSLSSASVSTVFTFGNDY